MAAVRPVLQDDPEQPDTTVTDLGPARESAPTSVLDLVNRTLADKERAANAAMLVRSVSKGTARVVVWIGIVLILGIVLVGLLIHFVGTGAAIGGAVAVGGVGAVAGGRYLRNRRAATRRGASTRRSGTRH